MPAIPSVLSTLIQTDVDAKMSAIAGIHPLAQKKPQYFVAMCTAIATGLINGGPVIMFTTDDSGSSGAPPVPGVGAGIGIVIDADFFKVDLYNRIMGYIASDLGRTTHEAYPPSAQNSGQYLLALCDGLSQAVKTHYATTWILTSAHPLIYVGTGQINEGHFSGLIDSAIKSAIIAAGPLMQGKFWPKIAQAIAESYVLTIQNHSTGMVTISGVCAPGPSQVCGIGSSGTGTGTAA